MWRRSTWIRLAALSGGASVLALIIGGEAVRPVAQVQFAHAMATFACATVSNIGGQKARLAPAFFLTGALVFCAPGYALAFGGPAWLNALQGLGAALLVIGWAVLAWAAGGIDRPLASQARSAPAPQPREALSMTKRYFTSLRSMRS